MSGEVLVRVEGVSKKFCRSLKKSLWYGLKDVLSEAVPFSSHEKNGRKKGGLRASEFWAVSDVSFQLRRGECLGLIGHNGAGKTSLLRLLNGLLKPDYGRIEMRGQVGALIALGAGFNPILTGRENVYVNAAVLGFSKNETDSKLGGIIDFAEIGDFIDAPVHSYSSGMQVRLGFAVASTLEPDILLLDEILAVGDAAFRNKCYNRLAKLRRNCATILVSHSMDQIGQVCDRAGVMSRGQLTSFSEVGEAIRMYERLMEGNDGEKQFEQCSGALQECHWELNLNSSGGGLEIGFEVQSSEPIAAPGIKLVLFSAKGERAAEYFSKVRGGMPPMPAGKSKWSIKTESLSLLEGSYKASLAIFDLTSNHHLFWAHQSKTVTVRGTVPYGVAYYQLGGVVEQAV